jgi:hypothetical protein
MLKLKKENQKIIATSNGKMVGMYLSMNTKSQTIFNPLCRII